MATSIITKEKQLGVVLLNSGTEVEPKQPPTVNQCKGTYIHFKIMFGHASFWQIQDNFGILLYNIFSIINWFHKLSCISCQKRFEKKINDGKSAFFFVCHLLILHNRIQLIRHSLLYFRAEQIGTKLLACNKLWPATST